MLSPGQVLCGSRGNKWRVSSQLGEGRCCVVYKCETVGADVKGAARVYKPGHDVSWRELNVLHEVRQQAGPCPNIVSALDKFQSGGRSVVVQELLDLDLCRIQMMTSNQGMSLYLVQKMTTDLVRALSALHSTGYIHADVKPSNLMWSAQDGCLKLIDFGLTFHKSTQVCGLVQSKCYRAPEVVNGQYGHSNDQAALDRGQLAALAVQRNVTSLTRGQSPGTSTHDSIIGAGSSSGQQRSVSSQNGVVSKLTAAIDMWSVGCLLHWMYTGLKLVALRADKLKTCEHCQIVDSTEKCEHSVLVEKSLTMFSKNDHPKGWDTFVSLVHSLVSCCPGNRLTASQVMEHAFLKEDLEPDYSDLLMLPTTVVRLLNTVDPAELDADEQYKDLVEDIREECEKYGTVEGCHVPRDGRGKGKAYVQYQKADDSLAAFEKLNGRTFNDRTVITSYFPVSFVQEENFF